MSEETLLKLRSMILDFGAPMTYWTEEQISTFSELEKEILRVRNANN